MATTANLMAVGMNGRLAEMLATGPIINVNSAGSTQGTATPVPSAGCTINAGATAGVILPFSRGNPTVFIFNSSANAQNVYPNVGDAINNLGVNAPYSLAAGKVALFAPGDRGWIGMSGT